MRVLALLLTAAFLAGCTSDPASALRSDAIEPSADAGSLAPASGTPEPGIPSPSPSATTALASSPPTEPPPTSATSAGEPLTWTRLGTIATGKAGSVEGVRRLGGGYVAWGTYGKSSDQDPSFTTWYSADGQTWEPTIHATSIVPCPGWTARPDINSVYAPASDDHTLVFPATYLLPDAEACDRAWMISLATTDGRTWSRSKPFGPPHNDPAWAMWAESSWPIPGGWETIVSDGSQVAMIWRTSDLATWTQVGSHAENSDGGGDFRVLGAGPDGTRLAVERQDEEDPEPAVLMTSSDAVSWQPALAIPAGFGVAGVMPPADNDHPWLVALESEEPEEARILVSDDLAEWTTTVMKKPGVADLTDAGAGWAAVGLWPSRETGCGDACRPERPSLYTSSDGLHWVNHRRSMPPDGAHLLAGPGDGEVFAGSPPSKGLVSVWQLETGS